MTNMTEKYKVALERICALNMGQFVTYSHMADEMRRIAQEALGKDTIKDQLLR